MQVHRVAAEEWQQVRDLRLRALLDSPDAFGSTYAREVAEPDSSWRRWATGWEGVADQAVFAALDLNGAWRGIALSVHADRASDTANLYAMWVEPAGRRRGAGRALVEAVAGWAGSSGLRRIRLGATVSNAGAVDFYRSCGFSDTGERGPLREGSDLEVATMERLL